MSRISQTRRLAMTAALAAFVSGGVLLAGRASAAPIPQKPTVSYRPINAPLDIDNRGKAAAKAKGRNNSVNQNSPTKNLGQQHNSSVNSGQNNFQAAQCRYCKIRQKIIVKKHFWGYSNHRQFRERFKWPSAGRAWSAASSSASAFSGWSHAMLSTTVSPADLPVISGSAADKAPE